MQRNRYRCIYYRFWEVAKTKSLARVDMQNVQPEAMLARKVLVTIPGIVDGEDVTCQVFVRKVPITIPTIASV